MMKHMMAASLAVALMSGTAIAAGMDKTMDNSQAMSNQSITASNIENLPQDGMVRVMGTVKDVKGSDGFTLMDGTGSVDVSFNGGTKVMEGEKVTVIGKIDDKMVGDKEIEAQQVTKGFETSEYRAQDTNVPYQNRGMDRGYEAERSDNIEYKGNEQTKPYTKDMSMNDYNKRTQTKDLGQTRLQPEKGVMED